LLRTLTVAGWALSACQGFGQSFSSQTTASRPGFEVASIKLNKSGDSRVMALPVRGGRFTVTNIPLQYVIGSAYGIKNSQQLSGAPPWLLSERYDIEAKAEGDPSFDAMLVMLQRLLEDRLQLKFHHETKDLPVYALVVSRPGKFQPAEDGCGPRPSTPTPCRFMILPGHLGGPRVTVAQLADALSAATERVVLDKTNLTGSYDISLDYTPEQGQFQALEDGAPTGTPLSPPIDANGPSLFTALAEQLGLKLEPQKGPLEVMVIDHVERPSEN
jgi:uncharacterized protein (TIGR03435 family)